MNSKTKQEKFQKKIGFVFLLLITLIVLFLFLKDSFYLTFFYIKKLNVFWLLLSFFCFNFYLACRAFVTNSFAHQLNSKYKFIDAFVMEYKIILLNAITPFSTGGKPYEIYSLKKKGLKTTEASNIAIQNFIIYQFALIIISFFALIYNSFFELFTNVVILKYLIIAGFILNILIIIGLFIISFAKNTDKLIINFFIHIGSKIKIIKLQETTKHKINNFIENFYDESIELSKNKLKFVNKIFIHIISLCSLYTIPLIIFYAMGDFSSLNIMQSIFISSFVMLIGLATPMPGGTGGVEYAFIFLFGNFITGVKLNALMITWRFITFYLPIIISICLISFKKRK